MTFRPLGKALIITLIFCGLALVLTFITDQPAQIVRRFATTLTTVIRPGHQPMANDAAGVAPAVDAAATNNATTMATAHLVSSVVDTTQDVKAMGYPDGRKVVRDRAGDLYVAYRKKFKQEQLTAYHIFVAKSHDNGTTWQVLNHGQPIEKVGDYNQRVPAIAIDDQQMIHVVWYGKDAQHNGSEENQIKYVRSSDGGNSWSAWRNIAPVSGYGGQSLWQEHPIIYVDTSHPNTEGTLYVAWEGRDTYYTNTSQVKLIKSVDRGDSWSTWVNVVPGQANHSRPALVATPQGALYLFAYGRAGASQQILYTYSTDAGRRWQPWSRLAPSWQDQRHLSVDADSQGNLHVVWRQAPDQFFGEGEARIHYTYFDGEWWRPPIQVAPTAEGAQTFPSIGIDQHDAVWITWSATEEPYAFPNDAPEAGTIAYRVKTDAGWSDCITLLAAGHDIYASLGRRNGIGQGDMGLIWLANQAAGKQIRFATLTLPTHFTTAPALASAGFFGSTGLKLGLLTTLAPEQVATALSPLSWRGSGQLSRELTSVLWIMGIVTLYVIAKYVIANYFIAKFSVARRLPSANHRSTSADRRPAVELVEVTDQLSPLSNLAKTL